MKRTVCLLLIFISLTWQRAAADPQSDIRGYIRHAWHVLNRSVSTCESYGDVRGASAPVLYLPAGFPEPAAIQKLASQCHIDVVHLPRPIKRLGDVQPSELPRWGLLYLPHPYVVPGGKFNEMYGWDSYFIMRGLLHDGQIAEARGMVDNYLFEMEHYGAILNANRSYYLTRSQPPFLTSAIRAVYASQGATDKQWLLHAYQDACQDWTMWTSAPHLAGDTGLSRFFDVGQGPAPEVKAQNGYYDQIVAWVLTHPGATDYVRLADQGKPAGVAGPPFDMVVRHDKAASPPSVLYLTSDYYLGDRAMRASGYDVSFRFGPFSGATHHFAPVCLNSLLYKTETDLQWMATELGKTDEAAAWQARAEQRRLAVNKYLWNESAGLYFDYDVVAGRQSTYHFATTFFPLWAGLASKEQAAAVASHLNVFEQPHGLAMSDVVTGAQWDKPFGWAPVNLLTVEGLAQYGYRTDASRLAAKFDSTVLSNFMREHTIREKYDVVTGSAVAKISVGYTDNVVGFGWTNATYLELLKYIDASSAIR